MKNRSRLLATALFGGALCFSAFADKVKLEQLPIELKDKIRIHTGSAAIEDIDRQTKGGKTTYQVAYKKNGQHTEITFNENGELVNSSGAPALDSRKVSYNELPEVVKKAADARLKDAQVNDVDRQVKNGQATYEIGFKENGKQQELVVSDDGRILSESPSVGAVGAAATSARGTASSRTAPTLPEPVMLSTSQKIQVRQAPAAVQKAITAAANGARIEDLERGAWQGKTVYQAAFKENGKHIELQVREDGTILHDPRKTTARGAASAYPGVTSLVPLSSAEKLDRDELPVTLQRRLTAQTNGRKIEDIERGTWQGKTIYQVAFKDENNKHIELQLDEHGNVVYDPRTKK